MNKDKLILTLIGLLIRERRWRLEDSDVGGYELNESLDMLESLVRKSISDKKTLKLFESAWSTNYWRTLEEKE